MTVQEIESIIFKPINSLHYTLKKIDKPSEKDNTTFVLKIDDNYYIKKFSHMLISKYQRE